LRAAKSGDSNILAVKFDNLDAEIEIQIVFD